MNNMLISDTTKSSDSHSEVTLVGLSSGRLLLQQLLESGVILPEEWAALEETTQELLLNTAHADDVVSALSDAQLLTEFQASRVKTGAFHHLVLGNYRILDRIGAGGMGVVYRGEHTLLRRPVAIKVLQVPANEETVLLKRFFAEMRAVTRIRHQNIVWTLDAGTVAPTEYCAQNVHYLVMEHVPGTNLEQIVAKAPLNIAQACDLIYQIAGALDETKKIGLIHRDIKPSNILVTPAGVAKLLDFGLALHFGRHRLTVPGILLGTLSYMAPEQAADAANVDIRADIFALGATLYYCLTGKPPFGGDGNLTHQVASRLVQSPPLLRMHRSDVPVDLESIVRRMMAIDRDDRYPTPQAVMRAILSYAKPPSEFDRQAWKIDAAKVLPEDSALVASPTRETPQILIVDDEQLVRGICASFLRRGHFQCHEACNGEQGLQLLTEKAIDLVLLDIDMPGLSGTEILRRLRENPPCDNLKIIMMSGGFSADDMSELLAIGADDYVTKPLSRHQLVTRVKTALLHKATQDRSALLNQQLLHMNDELEQSLTVRSSDLASARNGLVFALAKIVESRARETIGHLSRMTCYATVLAQQARLAPRFAGVLDEPFMKTLEACVILHDIGNVALPDHILQRTGALDPEDRIIMQSHTTIGAETLQTVAKRDRSAAAFWQMAIDIARNHHERFDGKGYPDRLAGNDIPLAARIVAIVDAYEGLRSPGTQGMELSHHAAAEIILASSRGRFDPLLLQAFERCAAELDRVFRAHPEADLHIG